MGGRAESWVLNIATWNIRHGLGSDGILDLERIASELAALDVDVVCLQEVEERSPRTRMVSQAKWIASRLGMNCYFAPNWSVGPIWRFGNAILGKGRLHSTWNMGLPSRGEPRGLAHACLDGDTSAVHIYCTHWGLSESQRLAQARVCGRAIGEEPSGLSVLCGDLNCTPSSEEARELLRVSNLQLAGEPDRPTFPNPDPRVRIDSILASARFRAIATAVPETIASDHRPIVTRLELCG
jgi:endonuclease/exonuclease/phosphatase family metal-dependent hydrolase